MLPEFIEIIPEESRAKARDWWHSLDHSTRESVLEFYEYGDIDPVIELARSLNAEMNNREKFLLIKSRVFDFELIEFPNKDYYENLIGKEVYLDARGPIFHICKSHKLLRQYLVLGFIPSKFTCPLSETSCRMLKSFRSHKNHYWQIEIQSYNRVRTGV